MSGVPDYTLESTLDFKFTTRQFSTGAPFAFAAGAVEIYEDNDIAQITGGETLTLEFDGVTGLHNLRVAATAANGFENGKSYHCVVSAGTVDSVSVVGEVVQQFSIGRSAAAVDLANGTDGLSAIKAETALIVEDTGTTIPGTITTLQSDTDDIQTRLPATLVGGAMNSDVSAMQAGSIASGTIAAAELTNIENEIWDAPKASHVVANSFGDFLDIEVSGRQPSGAVDLNADQSGVTIGTLNALAANVITAASINANALDGKGDWNIGKTGYSLTQTFPTNFADMSITITTGLVDITQAAADKAWGTAARVLTAGTNLNDISTAEVNAEVVDVMTVDTISELTAGVPAATPTIATGLMLMYMAIRNKLDVTSSFKEVHNNAGAVITKKALTDDGSTYSEAEMETGP